MHHSLLERDTDESRRRLKGVMMELADCAFPLLADTSRGGDLSRGSTFRFSPLSNSRVADSFAAVSLNHERKANMGFADGHVESWHPEKFKSRGFTLLRLEPEGNFITTI